MQLASCSKTDHQLVFFELRQKGEKRRQRLADSTWCTPEKDLSASNSFRSLSNELRLGFANLIVFRERAKLRMFRPEAFLGQSTLFLNQRSNLAFNHQKSFTVAAKPALSIRFERVGSTAFSTSIGLRQLPSTPIRVTPNLCFASALRFLELCVLAQRKLFDM